MNRKHACGLILLPILLVSFSTHAQSSRKQGTAEVGKRLPRVAAFDMGNKVHSSDRILESGVKGLVVQFMTTYCPPCKEEIRQLVKEKGRLDRAKVRVLIVDLLSGYGQLKKYVAESGASVFPVIRDRTGSIVDQFELRKKDPEGNGLTMLVPVSFVVDEKGILRRICRGAEDDYVASIFKTLRL
ncbi:MAG: TlpA family protein disulfide reductase [Deltaproteobacteria bacterium]|nr:TlpA family protein disulfide reductase [Deltaproteobacteria bacterium]